MRDAVVQRLRSRPPHEARTASERALARLPFLAVVGGLALNALSPRSRLRRVAVADQMRAGWDAATRRDFEVMKHRYRLGTAYEFPPQMVELGLPAHVSPRTAWLDALEDWYQDWERIDLRPDLLIDGGSEVLTLGTLAARGARSGIDLKLPFAQLIDVSGGRVARERDYNDWDEGLVAAGLGDPSARERIERLEPGENLVPRSAG